MIPLKMSRNLEHTLQWFQTPRKVWKSAYHQHWLRKQKFTMWCHFISTGIPTLNVTYVGDLELPYTDSESVKCYNMSTVWHSNSTFMYWLRRYEAMSTQKLYENILIHQVPNQKNNTNNTISKWINKLWHVCCYLAIKVNELLIQAANRLIQVLTLFTCLQNSSVIGNNALMQLFFTLVMYKENFKLKMSYL